MTISRLIVTTLLATAPFAANADVITDNSALGGDTTVIDFSEFDGSFQFTSGPVQVGASVGDDVEWSSTNSGSVIGNNGYGLASNGSWTSDRIGYVGLNTCCGDAYMLFNFAQAVNGIGGFVNYAPRDYGDAFLDVLGDLGQVLETVELNISTPGMTNAGEFSGFLRDQNDIYGLRLSGAYIVLDDLEYSRASVPEPGTLALFGLGLAGFGFCRRKKTA